jgi:hypothetical protein
MKLPMPSRDFLVVTGQLALLFLIGLGLVIGLRMVGFFDFPEWP